MIWDFFANHVSLLFELVGVFMVFAVALVVGAALLARFENVPFEDALYFAFITAFTVGFGDIAPHSRGGRVMTVLIAFIGLVVIGIMVAVAGHALNQALIPR